MNDPESCRIVTLLDEETTQILISSMTTIRQTRGLPRPTEEEKTALVSLCSHILAIGACPDELLKGELLPDVEDLTVKLRRRKGDVSIDLGDTGFLRPGPTDRRRPGDRIYMRLAQRDIDTVLKSLRTFRAQRGRPSATPQEQASLITWCEAALMWRFGANRACRGRWLVDLSAGRVCLFELDNEPVVFGDLAREAALTRKYSRLN
jgi:hypothetical protein